MRSLRVFSLPSSLLRLLFLFGQRPAFALQKLADGAGWAGAKIAIFGPQRHAGRRPSQIAQIANVVYGATNVHDLLEFRDAVVTRLPTGTTIALPATCLSEQRLFKRSYPCFESRQAHDRLQPKSDLSMPTGLCLTANCTSRHGLCRLFDRLATFHALV